MKLAIPLSIAVDASLIGLAGMALMAPQRTNPAFDFIAGNRPVTEDQVRQKLVPDGWWADIQIVLRGRFYMASASKDGQTNVFPADSLTGWLRGEDDDDDDWTC